MKSTSDNGLIIDDEKRLEERKAMSFVKPVEYLSIQKNSFRKFD